MPTRRLYRDDPYLLEFDARVLARLEHEGRPAVVLDETAFYAESGGQPWDLGTLDAVPVLAVVEKGDEIVHVLAAPLAADRVHGSVDGERRRDHRQQHHGQHLFSRALLEVAGARTVSFHLGGEASTIDLDRAVSDAQVRERAPAHERGDLGSPARARAHDDPGRGRGPRRRRPRGSRRRGAPRRGRRLRPAALRRHPPTLDRRGRLRGDLGQERYKGGSRVRFVCGHRALAAAREQGRILDRLAGLLSSARAELPEAVQRLLDQAVAPARRWPGLLERALRLEARQLFAEAAAARPAATARRARLPDYRDARSTASDRRRGPVRRSRSRGAAGLAQALVAEGPCLALLGTAPARRTSYSPSPRAWAATFPPS